jgi:hypothetical protein
MQIRQLGLYRALRIVGRSAGVDVVSMTQYLSAEDLPPILPRGPRPAVR